LIKPTAIGINHRFDQNSGFSTADDFATYLKDCFDLLYAKAAEIPKVLDDQAARLSLVSHEKGIARWWRPSCLTKTAARRRDSRDRGGHRRAAHSGYCCDARTPPRMLL
jgi:hypothetical protein